VTALLVSVRSAAEVEAALRGGAALIDVKEPAHGSLGRASDQTIAEVVRTVAGRQPVSAAMGEFAETCCEALPSCIQELSYLKWGLSRYADHEDDIWQDELDLAMYGLAAVQPHCRVVAVAYADWHRAEAPTPDKICSFAIEHRMGAFLLDTWHKDGSTLLDWLPIAEIERLRERCRAASLPLALAGSLGPAEIRRLRPLRPDWFAVRGAACRHRRRNAQIDEEAVRQLAALLGSR
jgi:uncharacterized protein (UPF0264 family)